VTNFTTFDYTEEDLENPTGRNSLGSRAMFFQRSLYKEVIYPTTCEPCSVVSGALAAPQPLPAPLDTWYDKGLYGKVDINQNIIVPDTSWLRQIGNAVSTNIFVLHPVAVMFDAFVEHVNRAQIMGAIDSQGNPKLYKLAAVKGWEDSQVVYNKYQMLKADAFIKNMSKRQKRTIQNFSTFLQEYKPYLRGVATDLPVTRANILLSKQVSLFASGLCIAVGNDPADADANKYDNFLIDENFEFYACAAKKFGFLVNKNMPWILTADVGSNAFKTLWRTRAAIPSTFPYTLKSFFDFYYKPAFENDMSSLVQFLANSYARLVERSPLYDNERILSYSATGELMDRCAGTLSARTPGFRAPPPEFDENLVSYIWPDLLNFYIDLKQIESGNAVTRLKNLRLRAAEVMRSRQDVGAAARGPVLSTLEFINDVYKNYIYSFSYEQVVPSNVSLDIRDRPDILTSIRTAQLIDPDPVDTPTY